MSGSINKVTLLGNLGRDPEIRSTQSGQVANLALATEESWKDKASGEQKTRTEWHRVTVWNENLIPVIEKFLHKGSRVYVEGALTTRKYPDQSGQDRYSTEVVLQKYRGELVLLDEGQSRPESPQQPVVMQRAPPSQQQNYASRGMPRQTSDDLDDRIPF